MTITSRNILIQKNGVFDLIKLKKGSGFGSERFDCEIARNKITRNAILNKNRKKGVSFFMKKP